MKSDVFAARRKRTAGEPLTEEEQELLRRYDSQYVKRQVKLTLTEQEIETYRKQAQSEGLELATWLAGHLRRGIQGEGSVAILEKRQKELVAALAELDHLKLSNAEQLLRLTQIQQKMLQYESELRQTLEQVNLRGAAP
jgi:hypothetical protein